MVTRPTTYRPGRYRNDRQNDPVFKRDAKVTLTNVLRLAMSITRIRALQKLGALDGSHLSYKSKQTPASWVVRTPATSTLPWGRRSFRSTTVNGNKAPGDESKVCGILKHYRSEEKNGKLTSAISVLESIDRQPNTSAFSFRQQFAPQIPIRNSRGYQRIFAKMAGDQSSCIGSPHESNR